MAKEGKDTEKDSRKVCRVKPLSQKETRCEKMKKRTRKLKKTGGTKKTQYPRVWQEEKKTPKRSRKSEKTQLGIRNGEESNTEAGAEKNETGKKGKKNRRMPGRRFFMNVER